MKKSILFVALAVVGLGLAAFNTPATVSKVNTKESKIQWKGYKVTGSHEGFISLKEGNLIMNDGVLTGGRFVVDMPTMTCTDLTGEYADKLMGHLKSDDFFGVQKFPTATLEITRAIPYGKPGEYKIEAKLTIKETTKAIKFNATVSESGSNWVGQAKITIDRSEYNVRYGSGSFFDSLGDKTIYDEFDLNVTLVSSK
jgi:polyisoprenoid-binding protein YceI